MKDNSYTKRVRFNSVEEIHELPVPKTFRVSNADIDSEDSDDGTMLEQVKPRRGAVNLDGYGSDASSDGQGSNNDKISSNKTESAADIDEDMFGDDKPDSKNHNFEASPSANKEEFNAFSANPKEEKPLDIDEIQGQEDSSDFGSDEEGIIRIEAFNLKDDMQEGKFDAAGNFVWNAKDPDEHHDLWLRDISKSEINRAKLAKERQAQRERSQSSTLAGDSELTSLDLLTVDEIKLRLLNLMQPHESVIGALSRLGGGSSTKRRVRVNKNRAKKEALENLTGVESDPKLEAQRKQEINRVTELAAHLLDQGHLNIYQETYESLVRAARISELIPDDWVPGTSISLPN